MASPNINNEPQQNKNQNTQEKTKEFPDMQSDRNEEERDARFAQSGGKQDVNKKVSSFNESQNLDPDLVDEDDSIDQDEERSERQDRPTQRPM